MGNNNNFDDDEFDMFGDSSDSFMDEFTDESNDINSGVENNNEPVISDNDEFENNTNNENKNSNIYIKIIITGVIVIVSVLIAMNILGSIKNNQNPVSETEVTAEVSNETSKEDGVTSDNTNQTDVIVNGTLNTNNTNGYTEIDGSDSVNISENMSDARFTITFIKHYAKMQGNEMRLKTELYGNISGLNGSYDLVVPYSIGTKLNIGDTFDVKIRLGEFNGNTVVDEIAY